MKDLPDVSATRRLRAPMLGTAVLAFTMLAASPATAQDCDCACESYAALKAAVEKYQQQQQQDAGGRANIPPEMMQMSQCAGQCAMAWAQCENPDMDMEAMQAAQKRALQQAQQGSSGYSGDDAIARERAINERRVGETEKDLQPDEPALPKERLTAEYLEGMWCSVYGGQETTQYRFHSNGSVEAGMPAGRGWQWHPIGDSIAEYHDRFEKLVEFGPDAFTTEHEHGRKSVFTRGPCN